MKIEMWINIFVQKQLLQHIHIHRYKYVFVTAYLVIIYFICFIHKYLRQVCKRVCVCVYWPGAYCSHTASHAVRYSDRQPAIQS